MLAAASTRPARAQQEPAVLSAVQYLRNNHANRQVGETAMVALGLLKAETPADDPAVAACLEKIRSRFQSGGYQPERSGGSDIYEAAVVALALANLPSGDRGSMMEAVGSYLMRKQKANGSWDYEHRTAGDTSISQYAVLGLWECENSGVSVPPALWDRAAQWYLSSQGAGGSWNYHRDESGAETVSMTAAGVGSLLICRRQLERHRTSQKGQNPYLAPVVSSGPEVDYKPTTSPAQLNAAIGRGLVWLASHFNPTDTAGFGMSVYYGLYGIERIGALADRQALGRFDWFEKGAAYIRSTQRPDGSWAYPPFSAEVTTAWAVLFLTKSTRKSLQRVEGIAKLGSGTLLGGRYLPADLTSMTVAGGRIISRPMNGAVDGMLDVLEDPRLENGDTAVAGLVERYQKEGAPALRPYKDRFRKMLKSRDPSLREIAAWALGRIGDLDSVPELAAMVEDPDERVVAFARISLQLISRKIDGPGPEAGASPEQKRAAAAAWKAWYESARPLDAAAGDATPGRAGP